MTTASDDNITFICRFTLEDVFTLGELIVQKIEMLEACDQPTDWLEELFDKIGSPWRYQ